MAPFRQRRRFHVPTATTWERAAEIDRRLRWLGGYEASLMQRSFLGDMLLAATAREISATVITQNLADFQIIRRVLDVRVVRPWPGEDAVAVQG